MRHGPGDDTKPGQPFACARGLRQAEVRNEGGERARRALCLRAGGPERGGRERQNHPDDRARCCHGPHLRASRRAGLTGDARMPRRNPHGWCEQAPGGAAVRCGDVAEPAVPITELLLAWGAGDERALEQLVPVVYAELHRMAHRHMRREPHQSLQATSLVNELYVRLVDAQAVKWHDRAHFFAISSRLMRRILVDAARRRNMRKRGGGGPSGHARRGAGRRARTRTGSDRARRGARRARGVRSAQGARRRDAVFCGAQRAGNRGGARGLRGHRHARLELREDMAAAGAQQALSFRVPSTPSRTRL